MNDQFTAPISAVFEVHPALLDGICRLLDQRKDWDGDRVVNAAIALYLLQAGDTDPDIRRVYLGQTFSVEERP
jgi:hypothetical protein